jgi:O-Antigen ligase/Tetratricopeptide repeat
VGSKSRYLAALLGLGASFAAAMSTAELTAGRTGIPGSPTEAALSGEAARTRLPSLLTGALLAVVLYAAFEHGAVALPAEARLQVAITALAATAGAAWLWTGTLRFTAPRLALVGTALLAAFACWSGVTLLWSVAPNQTWIELNRAITYVLTLCMALALGASYARAIDRLAIGYLLVALLVTLYALGQKLFPGLHVAGVFDLNQTGPLPRLQAPLGYWNALALFVAMAVPIALAVAADARRGPRVRLAALGAIELMLLVVAFTYSRGGLLTLAAGLAIAIAAGAERLRSAIWLAAAAVASVPPLVFGLDSHALTTAGVSLGDRELAGAEVALVLLASLAVLVVAGDRLLVVEPRLRIPTDRAPGLRRLALALVAALVIAALVAISVSSRGLGGSFSHAWHTFTSTKATSNINPRRLLSADSQNRWVWWKEAAGAFSDRPLGGWGAGSFSVVHLLYRKDSLTVQQPHSVPLQFLAETGIVGGLLAIAGFVLVLVSAARLPRRLPRGPERLLAAALLGGAVGYAVHTLYDWDWDIPAVTLPPLLFLGVLAGARCRDALPVRVVRSSATARTLSLGALTLWLCAFALSAALPSLAAGRASAALVKASSTNPASLRSAQSSAALASDLDPLSDAGLRVEATIALHRRRLALARAYLLQAVARDPTDLEAWAQLGQVYALIGDTGDAERAARRLLALDPRGPWVRVVARAQLLNAPPAGSVTAIQTPQRPK